MSTIAILGGGNLGTAILKGLQRSNEYSKDQIIVTEKRLHRQQYLKESGFNVLTDNSKAVVSSDIIITAVKPQQIKELLDEIKPSLEPHRHIIISTVTGFSTADFEKKVGLIPIFRIMPNTAIEICESITCIALNQAGKEKQEKVVNLFDKLGKTVVIDEALMGAATVIGACGIAFALRFIRAATQGGIEIGFGSELSQLIAAQTVRGATELILQNQNHPEEEIDKVTTPQGITISGLNEMEHQGFSSALIKGLVVSYNKLVNLEKAKNKND